MGTLAAFGWSLYALFFGTAGEPGMTHPFELTIQRSDGGGQHLPRGRCRGDDVHPRRPLPRGRGRSAGPAPRCARCSSWAPRTSRVLRRRRSRRGCRSSSSPSATGSSSGPGRRSPPTAWSRRAPPRSTPRCSPASRCRSRSASATRVVGATVNAGGRLVVRATRVGADTQLAQMARLVEDAQNGKADGAAAGRPDLRRLRAGRDRARRRPPSASGSAAAQGLDGGVHRRGRGADHRLPVRARTGHADRPDGRHRPGRPARHPDQGARGARADPRASTPSCSTRPARSRPAG